MPSTGRPAATGGGPIDGPGYFFQPTVLTGAAEGTRIVDEEQFGPALPVIPYPDVDDVVDRGQRHQLRPVRLGVVADVDGPVPWPNASSAARPGSTPMSPSARTSPSAVSSGVGSASRTAPGAWPASPSSRSSTAPRADGTAAMDPAPATGAARYVGTRVPRVEDARLLTGHGTFVDDIALPGMLHACFVRSPFARAAIRGIDTSAALRAARRARGVHRRRPQPRRQGAVAHVDRPARSRRRRARRWPRTRCASSATRSRWWSPRPLRRRGRGRAGRRRLRAAARGRRLRRRPTGADELVHAEHGSNVVGELRRPAPRRRSTSVFGVGGPRRRARRSTSRRTPRCRWRRAGIVVDYVAAPAS